MKQEKNKEGIPEEEFYIKERKKKRKNRRGSEKPVQGLVLGKLLIVLAISHHLTK